MPKCTAGQMEFGRLGRRVLSADFDGGALSSDGGLMLLRRVDERIGLSRAVASVLHDARNPDRITHDMRALVAQRLYALCCGYEDLNDHEALRKDIALQTATQTDQDLASASTLCQSVVRIDGQTIGDGTPGPVALRLRALYIVFARATPI